MRELIDKAISETTDPDRIAKLEILREYLTNPEFKKALEDYIWLLNGGGK